MVRLSASALGHNIPAARARGGGALSPLHADAWGHGAAWVSSILTAEGIVPQSVDADTLFGLPGGDAEARPVLSLVGTVLSTKDLRTGEGVSYGYAHRAEADTRIALVTGGYAQGIVRMLGGRVAVLIGGAMHPLIGRIAMDVCVVEIGDHAVARGDEVAFFGDPHAGEPSLETWVRATGWSAGELVAATGRHAAREVGP